MLGRNRAARRRGHPVEAYSRPSHRSSPRSSGTAPVTRTSVHERGTWPVYDAELAAPQRANIAITVDGKRRGEFEVDAGTSEADLSALALAHPRVVELLGGRPPGKVIAVVDRIVNIVTA